MDIVRIYDLFMDKYDVVGYNEPKLSVKNYLERNGYDINKYGIRCGCIILSNRMILLYYVNRMLTIYKK